MGHNQGGGEQNAEWWILDPATMKWELKEPNAAPPEFAARINPVHNRFLYFSAFSGNHGFAR